MADIDRERWDARWREARPQAPSSFLVSLDASLPRAGRALDVAGGPGHDALWLAARGLAVTLVDVSPVALERARAEAARRRLALETVERDLERLGLPDGPFDVVVCFNYLERRLFPRFEEVLAEGGLLLFAQPTRTNLQRHARPSARFLLEPGELRTLVPPGLTIVSLEEGWTGEGRHEARLVARRPRAH